MSARNADFQRRLSDVQWRLQVSKVEDVLSALIGDNGESNGKEH